MEKSTTPLCCIPENNVKARDSTIGSLRFAQRNDIIGTGFISPYQIDSSAFVNRGEMVSSSPQAKSFLQASGQMPFFNQSDANNNEVFGQSPTACASTTKLQKPKRALNAYNIFFRQERQRLLEQLPVRAKGKPRNSHGKLGFEEMARTIGARWKALSLDQKEYYEKLAAKEKIRYTMSMERYKKEKYTLAIRAVEEISEKTIVQPIESHESTGIEYLAKQLSTAEIETLISMFRN